MCRMVVYTAYGKYLIVLRFSTGTILRTIEIPSNNIKKPFYCGVGKYYEDILWFPRPTIEALSLHKGRLLVVSGGYFRENNANNTFDHVLPAFMSTLAQIFDVNYLSQSNTSYDGLLSAQYINGYYKYLYTIRCTSYIVMQSHIDPNPILIAPFRRYANDDDENVPLLTDEEYT
jgi:hypothetical protein